MQAVVNTVVAACSDHRCNDQLAELIEIAWKGSPVSKHIKNPRVLEINNSLFVIGFDETSLQNMATMIRGKKRNHHQPKRLCRPSVL
ncbi:hypothetical protein AVEN_35989-1 [Araneus ventricosus]|uniref:Uncharacterized protein n=1 Tax=Araneus ventricosus TaxID=182803 RepID=A0A4Y2TI51_ARAVE|nr:hypothetical protein AVEN_20541-1 [Araneus ventricosus]GBO00322.1 hypothetical protein AVEN_35989-1 [Araneus ventricosus]